MADTVMIASRTIHGYVNGVCQRGQVPDETIDQSHALKTTATTPSTLLTDCHGKRTSGRNSSNGAMIARAQMPTYAVVATLGARSACSDFSDTLPERTAGVAKSASAAAVEVCRSTM
jgi:hypothetical protein